MRATAGSIANGRAASGGRLGCVGSRSRDLRRMPSVSEIHPDEPRKVVSVEGIEPEGPLEGPRGEEHVARGASGGCPAYRGCTLGSLWRVPRGAGNLSNVGGRPWMADLSLLRGATGRLCAAAARRQRAPSGESARAVPRTTVWLASWSAVRRRRARPEVRGCAATLPVVIGGGSKI